MSIKTNEPHIPPKRASSPRMPTGISKADNGKPKVQYKSLPFSEEDCARLGLEPGTLAFGKGECLIFLSRHPKNGAYHLSISCKNRLPTWDELHDARYDLIPDDVTMAMILPPKAEYVNVHEFCFHIYQVNIGR